MAAPNRPSAARSFSSAISGKRRLPQPQSPDRLPAEEAVHPLEHDVAEVLDFDRGRSLDPQHERARFGRVAVGSPRPLDLFRLRMGRDLGAHDLGPTGDEFARSEALLGERIGQRLVQKI
jgi:hypothetical protein